MAHVLIICGSGVSSSLLKEAAQRSTEAYQADITFESTSFAVASTQEIKNEDLILVAPQVTCDLNSLSAKNIPIEKIPNDIYGWLNGENLVKFTMNELNKNQVA